ncbi:MAG: thiamine phosphate synthase [Planctomycetes bacterium]|nr:thiamine phosphate synthase [Planctomycetota bacterium]
MPGWRRADGSLDAAWLRLVLVTDGVGDPARLEAIVAAAVDAGLRCVQLREPSWTARQLLRCCDRLRSRLEAVAGVLIVNDRLEVAAIGGAHGAHLGARSIPIERARAVLGPEALLSYSAHDEAELAAAAAAGCDWASLSPVWPTTCKPGGPHLGEALALQWTRRAGLPVVWLGGVGVTEADRAAKVATAGGPAGVAVRSAIMTAADAGRATDALLQAMA